jgi:hypothetical protein
MLLARVAELGARQAEAEEPHATGETDQNAYP